MIFIGNTSFGIQIFLKFFGKISRMLADVYWNQLTAGSSLAIELELCSWAVAVEDRVVVC
jgi:hypothetical protein